jgi:hypothetical protein
MIELESEAVVVTGQRRIQDESVSFVKPGYCVPCPWSGRGDRVSRRESTVVMQRVIQEMDSSREMHVYDSFCGLPPGETADKGVYKPGEMCASQREFNSNFDSLKLKRPGVHPGWFEETLPALLPAGNYTSGYFRKQ